MLRLSLGMLLLTLAGCALPGQQLDVSEDAEPVVLPYELVPISPEVVMALAPAAQATAIPNPELDAAISDYEYRVGPQDVLTFTVWDHPEITIPAGEFRDAEVQGHLVAADGSIFFPYVGVVEVSGRTLSDIRGEITRDLSRYIQGPQLDVRVAAFRSQRVNVSGEVSDPGVLPISDVPMTLVEALALSGGETEAASLSRVQVTRGERTTTHDVQALLARGDLSQNLLLQHGDVIYVPDASWEVVHVLGEVGEQGAVPMVRSRLNLAEALSLSGGPDQGLADVGRVFVIRPADEGLEAAVVYHLDASSPESMLLATQFGLQPQDVVFVAAQGLTRWNRLIQQILPTVQTLWQTQNFIERATD